MSRHVIKLWVEDLLAVHSRPEESRGQAETAVWQVCDGKLYSDRSLQVDMCLGSHLNDIAADLRWTEQTQ